jgi:phosphatidylglycerol:prolipoprotein diacylglycerol transferase
MASITISLDPQIHVGALSLAWHGLMIAVGIFFGARMSISYARRKGLPGEPVTSIVAVLALAGIVGSRLFYLLLNQPAGLADPTQWLGSRGFAFYGALILSPLAVAIYIHRRRLSLRYLDACAYGFPLGTAIGRIGDLISGEHYGSPTNVPWGVLYTNPHAEVPHINVAYHSGGLYEIVLGLGLLIIVLLLRDRLKRPTQMLWLVIGLYGAGRFVMFFYRADSAGFALGFNDAQAASLLIMLLGLGGLLATHLRSAAPDLTARPVGSS